MDLNILFEHPISLYFSLALLLIAVASMGLTIQRFITAYRHAGKYCCATWFVRGIRCLLVSLTACAWSAGFYWNQRWLLIIGLVIICQELYEGLIISSALRSGAKIEQGEKIFLIL